MTKDVRIPMIVEVTALCDVAQMDPDDRDNAGNCAVDGAYRIVLASGLAARPDLAEAALDVFHLVVPIACLEDFDILARQEATHDVGDGWLRSDLGVFHDLPPIPALILEP